MDSNIGADDKIKEEPTLSCATGSGETVSDYKSSRTENTFKDLCEVSSDNSDRDWFVVINVNVKRNVFKSSKKLKVHGRLNSRLRHRYEYKIY